VGRVPIPANALFVGDIVEVNPYWPHDYPDTHWLARLEGFGAYGIHVEAVDQSDDPLVENESTVSFRAVTFKERP
jgi:hypothetical protein